MAEHIPFREPERIADGRKVARVVFDASTARTWWTLRRTSPTLIVEDQLPMVGERSESGPQQVVIEEKSTVHADKRNGAGFLRREKNGEVEPACVNDAPDQARRSRARASKSDESFAGCYLRWETTGDKIVMCITYATLNQMFLVASAISDRAPARPNVRRRVCRTARCPRPAARVV